MPVVAHGTASSVEVLQMHCSSGGSARGVCLLFEGTVERPVLQSPFLGEWPLLLWSVVLHTCMHELVQHHTQHLPAEQSADLTTPKQATMQGASRHKTGMQTGARRAGPAARRVEWLVESGWGPQYPEGRSGRVFAGCGRDAVGPTHHMQWRGSARRHKQCEANQHPGNCVPHKQAVRRHTAQISQATMAQQLRTKITAQVGARQGPWTCISTSRCACQSCVTRMHGGCWMMLCVKPLCTMRHSTAQHNTEKCARKRGECVRGFLLQVVKGHQPA
jgi:hypothetical protein